MDIQDDQFWAILDGQKHHSIEMILNIDHSNYLYRFTSAGLIFHSIDQKSHHKAYLVYEKGS